MPLQIFRIGSLITVNTPNEMTTMSGRRLRKAIAAVFKDAKSMPEQDMEITIGGLSNSYSHYVATFEEYQAQRYEAASTLYGPHTLSAYIQEFSRLSHDLIQGRNSTSEEAPADLLEKQLSLKPGVVFDNKPLSKDFGQVLSDARGPYIAGTAIVSVKYQGANPRNNLRLQDTFLTVVRQDGKVIASDSNWETKFHWRSTDLVASESEVTIEWAIPSSCSPGTYRICYHGDWKSGWTHRIRAFTGCSSNFTVNKGSDILV